MKRAWRCLLMGLALSAPAAAQQDIRYGISAGADISTGDFGLESDTTLLYLPVTLRVDRGEWIARATFSWLRVTGPAGATTLGGATRERQSGPGDVQLALNWAPSAPLFGNTWLDLGARVKVPTADEDRGLGTGSFDYTVQGELLSSIGDWTPFVSLGYRILGDAPGVPLSNGFIASAGIDRRLGAGFNAGGLLDWREPGARRSDDVLEAVPYLSWRGRRGYGITGYATLGLAGGSPDHGFGVQISYRSAR